MGCGWRVHFSERAGDRSMVFREWKETDNGTKYVMAIRGVNRVLDRDGIRRRCRELDKIVDVTMGTSEAVHRAAELEHKVFIRTEDGKERPYEVRPLVQQRLAKLSKGDAVVLLVDEENKVTDVAFLPKE
jgi:hypothetical protein